MLIFAFSKNIPLSSFNIAIMNSSHPIHMIGRVVDIVGIFIGDHGRSCKKHKVYCGVVLAPDVLVHLMKEKTMVKGRLETAICVYWATDSVEQLGFCLVTWCPTQTVSIACWHKCQMCSTTNTQARTIARRCTTTLGFSTQQSLTLINRQHLWIR